MAFGALELTNAGMQAINQVAAGGHTLNTVGAQAGSGYPASGEDPATYTQLKNYVMPMTNVSANALVLYQTTVEASVSSANAPSTFQINEIGVYASLDGGPTFLFSYATTGGPSGDIISPSGAANAVIKDYVLATAYSRTAQVGTTITLTTLPAIHASTHLPSGTDPLPISTSAIGGLCPKTNNNANQVLSGGATAAFGTLPLHAPTHLDNGPDPIPVATTSRTGSLVKLSGNADDRLDGTGAWNVTHPAGAVVDFAGNAAPVGWLLCDGQPYSTSTYARLFSIIGYTFGGSGGTFNVPDCRGRVSVGAGAGAGLTNRALGSKFGEESHTISLTELPVHSHTIPDPGHIHTTTQGNHSHGVSDPWHAHSVSEGAGHSHGVADPQHLHPLNSTQLGLQMPPGGSWQTVQVWPYPTDGTYLAATNISIAKALTGIAIVGAATNIGITGATAIISVDPHVTGITGTANAGSGSPANVCQPSIVFNRIIKT
jgi:microcystin-dependent protein